MCVEHLQLIGIPVTLQQNPRMYIAPEGSSRIDRGRIAPQQTKEHVSLAKGQVESEKPLEGQREKENSMGQGVRQRAAQRRALLIGICYGQGQKSSEFKKLNGPHRDVGRFRKMLIDVHHYRKEDIVVMIDRQEPGHSTPPHLVPTKENMVRELHRLVEGAERSDRFVFVFSGHSDQQEQSLADNDQPEEDDRDEVIITSDGETIVDNDLRRWLVEPLPAGSGLTAIIDSCHSGTMLDLPHRLCNGIYVPWISRSMRRTGTMHSSPNHSLSSGHSFPSISDVIDAGSQNLLENPLRLETYGLPPHGTVAASSPRSPLSTIQSLVLGDVLMSSPVCELPDPIKYCSGYCTHNKLGRECEANVISLSACKDKQRAWEDKHGRSMIWMLCDYLTKHHADHDEGPSYRELMSYLNHRLYKIALDLHEWTREQKRVAKGPVDGEMATFQTPELSSLVPLNMKDKIHI
ncbi:caspase domain-containing protein [Amylostereum chailletii]|nr:caspase domain-containing protein [Amylostereum chailletii]